MEKPGRYHPNQVIEVHVTSMGHTYLWRGHANTEKEAAPRCGVPPEMENLHLIMKKKNQTNFTGGQSIKITDPYSSKMSKSCETEKG